MAEMHNNVLVRVTKAKTGKTLESWHRNLRTDIGVNWQVYNSIRTSYAAIRNIALSSRATAPVSGDTDLKGELAADGLSRKTGDLSFTADQSLATLSESWKYTGASTLTLQKAAIAFHAVDDGTSSDTHFLITAISPVAVLDSNDTIAIDWGINF